MKRFLKFSVLSLVLGCFNFVYADDVKLETATYQSLPGWMDADLRPSFYAYQRSCRALLKNKLPKTIASIAVPFQVPDWQIPCRDALKLTYVTHAEAKHFFEKWFSPVGVLNGNDSQGLFTGYYLPGVDASLIKTKIYHVPVYARPRDLVTTRLGWFNTKLQNEKLAGRVVDGKLYPYRLTREQINHNGLQGKAKVVAWVKNRPDRFFLQVQGSGVLNFADGKKALLVYNGENGEPYYPIGRWLFENHQIPKSQLSMQSIKHWLYTHPKKADWLMDQNKSFIFFKLVRVPCPFGTENIPLTDGYSLAVNTKVVPLGTPVWLQTTIPSVKNVNESTPLQRLMVAQDTGGAIKGVVRGDIYFGTGAHAALLAGHMQNPGRYWLLLPKSYVLVLR